MYVGCPHSPSKAASLIEEELLPQHTEMPWRIIIIPTMRLSSVSRKHIQEVFSSE